MPISRVEAITILNGIVSVDTQGSRSCDNLGCHETCVMKATAQMVLDDDFSTNMYSDLVMMSRSNAFLESCSFAAIQKLATELRDKTR